MSPYWELFCHCNNDHRAEHVIDTPKVSSADVSWHPLPTPAHQLPAHVLATRSLSSPPLEPGSVPKTRLTPNQVTDFHFPIPTGAFRFSRRSLALMASSLLTTSSFVTIPPPPLRPSSSRHLVPHRPGVSSSASFLLHRFRSPHRLHQGFLSWGPRTGLKSPRIPCIICKSERALSAVGLARDPSGSSLHRF